MTHAPRFGRRYDEACRELHKMCDAVDIVTWDKARDVAGTLECPTCGSIEVYCHGEKSDGTYLCVARMRLALSPLLCAVYAAVRGESKP